MRLFLHFKINLLITFIFSFVFISKSNDTYSQDVPKIMQPSPEAAALFRFNDYPMDYSTGLPQINIPIYEIKSGSLSVPISISYHASGRKVFDQNGPVALGWSLNAGGMISRTIHGSIDFGRYKFPYPFTKANLDNERDLGYLERIMHFDKNIEESPPGYWMDSEYDIFSFNLGNNSGKFIFKDNNNVKTPVLLSHKPYTITPYASSTGLDRIDIVDDKGTTYKFVASEGATYSSDYGRTGYALEKIISADKADEISFVYTTFFQERVSISQTETIEDWYPSAPTQSSKPPLESTSRNSYEISRLKEIHFKLGKVLFNLVNGRDQLDNIQLVSLNGKPIKTIQFNRSYRESLSFLGFAIDNLDGLSFKDKTGATVENYSFEYYPTKFVAPATEINVRHRDWWGYYNASGQDRMVPLYQVDYVHPGGIDVYNIGNPTANREPNLEALKSGVLKKIIYPTGGSSEFIYENNKYKIYGTSTIKDGPGLRVSQILTNDNNGIIQTKSYKYGEDESGHGEIDLLPGINTMASAMMTDYIGGDILQSGLEPGGEDHYRSRFFYSDFIPELTELAERPVVYKEVAEYRGTKNNNIGKTIYNYDYALWGPSGMPDFPAAPGGHSLGINRMHISNFNYWNTPSLIKQTDYKFTGNATVPYQPIKETVNIYTANHIENVDGLHVQRIREAPQTGIYRISGKCVERTLVSGLVPRYSGSRYIYTYNPYQIPVGIKNLNSTTETIYNDDGTQTKNTIDYTYNSRHLISQKKVNTSENNTFLYTNITYPFDYTNNPILNQMTSLNMLNFLIEQKELKNATPIKSIRTNFYNWGNSNPMISPQTVEVKKGDNDYETSLRYYNYDPSGNPGSLSKENDAVHSYLWDYNRTYPVAEVINSILSNTAYTSFEAEGTGNWSGIISTNIKDDVSGITGKKYYNLSGSTLTISGLISSNVYLISYWSRSTACTVSGTALQGWPKNLKQVTINGVSWNYFEHRVSGATTISVSGTSSIDELRLYPANSQMNSYTYEPLLGITSQCDVNNQISYFEYDAYGRLKLNRDINGNIIKTYNYQLQSSTP